MKSAFYNKCLEAYHDVLKTIIGDSSVINVPELDDLAYETAAALVDDIMLDFQYMNNRAQYRFVLIAMSIQYGIVHASWLKKEPERFSSNILQLNTTNLNNIAMLTTGPEMGCKSPFCNQVFSWVYDEWRKLVQPDWTLDKNRESIIETYAAAYQFGVSWYMQTTTV